MRINHNIAALNTHRQLNSATNAQSKSMEKLSSGLRINRAGDDAAGLAISEKMRGQIRGLDMAAKNAQDGISLIQTAEGALNETHDILQRMRELSVQSANDTNNDNDRAEIQKEMTQLLSEVDRISNDTEFNTKKLLNGGFGGQVNKDAATSTVLGVASVAKASTTGAVAGDYTITVTAADGSAGAGALTMEDASGNKQTIVDKAGEQSLNFSKFGISLETKNAYVQGAAIGVVQVTSGSATVQLGANEGQEMQISIGDMGTGASGLDISGVDVSTKTGAQSAITTIQSAIDTVSSERSKLGAFQNRLEHSINNLNTSSENLTAAESRIRDVDYTLAA